MNADESNAIHGVRSAESEACKYCLERISNGADSTLSQLHWTTRRCCCCCCWSVALVAPQWRATASDPITTTPTRATDEEIPLLWPANLARPRVCEGFRGFSRVEQDRPTIMATRRTGQLAKSPRELLQFAWFWRPLDDSRRFSTIQFVSIYPHKFPSPIHLLESEISNLLPMTPMVSSSSSSSFSSSSSCSTSTWLLVRLIHFIREQSLVASLL